MIRLHLNAADLLWCVAFLALSQIASAQAQNTINAGYGTLTYSYSSITEHCVGRNGRELVAYTVTSFNNFSYRVRRVWSRPSQAKLVAQSRADTVKQHRLAQILLSLPLLMPQ